MFDFVLDHIIAMLTKRTNQQCRFNSTVVASNIVLSDPERIQSSHYANVKMHITHSTWDLYEYPNLDKILVSILLFLGRSNITDSKCKEVIS